ncbi:MAG: cytochrome-c peroxidase [Owenweeksia sp.]|nr:cytochrome-c peroxidase [Owenweeksia sp.]
MIEAMRSELVRIFTLGLTGFDTPGSLHALEEATVALSTLQTSSQAFLKLTDDNKASQVDCLYHQAITALKKADDFDNFDRLHFLRNYVNPLYHELQSLKDKDESLRKKPSGRNTASTNLFAKNFLDPYHFTELNPSADSEALRKLGEKLFYDPLLSASGNMSCASCHNPSLAFTDGKAKSLSNVVGQKVQRNAPTLLNAVYSDRYFYDLRAFSLEQQAEHVIFNHEEFNTAYEEILPKLKTDKEYQGIFKEVFGRRQLTRKNFSEALVSYVMSLQSFNSPFDQYVRGEVNEIKPKVKTGFNLFMGKAACGTCHFPPTFSGLVPPLYVKNESEILGVVENPRAWKKELDPDWGRYSNQIQSEQAWIYERSFKTTTVRNIEVTAPYFHNGAYQTLEQLVNFYDHGGGAGLGLVVKNQTLASDSLHLSSDEKEALIAFMKSLTDTSGYQASKGRTLSSRAD